MAQHFLKSKECRTLPLANVLRMTEDAAYRRFCKARWPDGPSCPRCGVLAPWAIRRRRFKCREKTCRCEFSVTSGTIFANRKLPFRSILAIISMSANAVKSKAALQVARELGVEYKTAWANLMKLREAMAAERQLLLREETVEIDGMYIGGHVRPKNRREERVDRRRRENRNPDRRCVIGMRQRNGRTATVVATGEDAEVALTAVQIYVATHARIVADEHPAYDLLHVTHEAVERVNHGEAYRGENGASTNWIESFFSRARRSERGIHHRMASQYLDWYAADLAWKEDMRRKSNGDLVASMLGTGRTSSLS
jgi:hypothetical protein